MASRGLDIPEVEVVLNIHCPKDIDTLVHRSGRTARMGKQGKSIIIADSDDRKRLLKYKKDFGLDKIKTVAVPLSNLDPLRGDIDKLKSLEKADFKTTTQGRDIKWKQKIAQEIEVELSDGENNEEEAEIKQRKETIQERKVRMKENLSRKSFKGVSYKRNVYLTAEDMKRLNEELAEMKKQGNASIRDTSNVVTRQTIINDPDLPAWKRVQARNLNPRHTRVRKRGGEGQDDVRGTFDNIRGQLEKRKPKHYKGSKRKFKRR